MVDERTALADLPRQPVHSKKEDRIANKVRDCKYLLKLQLKGVIAIEGCDCKERIGLQEKERVANKG